MPSVLVIALIVLAAAFAPPASAAPVRPFGSHLVPLAPRTLQPSGDPGARDRATAAAYDAWAAR